MSDAAENERFRLFERVFDSFVLDHAAEETLFRVELVSRALFGRQGASEAVLEIFRVHGDYVVALRTARGYGLAVACPDLETAKKLAAKVLEVIEDVECTERSYEPELSLLREGCSKWWLRLFRPRELKYAKLRLREIEEKIDNLKNAKKWLV